AIKGDIERRDKAEINAREAQLKREADILERLAERINQSVKDAIAAMERSRPTPPTVPAPPPMHDEKDTSSSSDGSSTSDSDTDTSYGQKVLREEERDLSEGEL
ncbi:hypothetical protein AAMO2058_000923400, partial [Amorphochlora amoebiformis]